MTTLGQKSSEGGQERKARLPAALLLSINRGFISVRFSVLHATASVASGKRQQNIIESFVISVRMFFRGVQTKIRYWSFSLHDNRLP